MTRLWGDGPPLWAVYSLGERGPRLTFCDDDGSAGQGNLAHLTVAALALAAGLTRLADLRVQPLALAQFLAAVPAGILERAGAIVMGRAGRRRWTRPPIDPARLQGVERTELVVDALDPRAIRFRVGVGAATPDQARQAAAALDELLRGELAPATYSATTSTTGGRSVIDVRLTDWIEPVAESFAGNRNEPPPPEAPAETTETAEEPPPAE